MGDVFIEGVGDEVVLFSGFLALSLAFLIVAALWQRQQREPNHGTNTRPEEAPRASQQVADNNQTGRETANTEHVQNRTESEGLRHRLAAASSRGATNADSSSPRREEVEDTEEGGVAGGRVSEDAEMTIRLVRAGMSEHPLEVCVTPSCTIDQLRR